MGQGKQSKQETNKTLQARTAFLFRASVHLQKASKLESGQERVRDFELHAKETSSTGVQELFKHDDDDLYPSTGSQKRLIAHMRSASRKGQLRMSKAIKRSVCKRCDTLLKSSTTCSEVVENKSRGGRKAWADVRIVTCKSCTTVKRFPIGAKRQPRKSQRERPSERVPAGSVLQDGVVEVLKMQA